MREKFVSDNVYHILNRGVDKRKIFLDDKDYFRFVHDLFEFNDTEPINNTTYSFNNTNNVIARRYIDQKPRKLLVEILAFCLMPSHYHILLRPKFDEAAIKFTKRLNMGYARYFNEKYERSGALFQGRYKSITIKNETHFTYIPHYIHMNPLDLIMPEWRENKIIDHEKAMQFLENYRWSSFPDYIGKKNFPSVTQREFLGNIFQSAEKYKNDTFNWLKEIDINELKESTLE